MCVSGFTNLSAAELLRKIHQIESSFGRERENETRNGPRSIDIDIELYGTEKIDFCDSKDKMKNLQIPHPRLQERAFVLLPLLDVLPKDSDILNALQIRGWLSEIRKKDEHDGKSGQVKKLLCPSDFEAMIKKAGENDGRLAGSHRFGSADFGSGKI